MMKLKHFEEMTEMEWDVYNRAQDMGMESDEFWNWYFNQEEEMGTWRVYDKYGKTLKHTDNRDEAFKFASMTPGVAIEFSSNVNIRKESDDGLRPMIAEEITFDEKADS